MRSKTEIIKKTLACVIAAALITGGTAVWNGTPLGGITEPGITAYAEGEQTYTWSSETGGNLPNGISLANGRLRCEIQEWSMYKWILGKDDNDVARGDTFTTTLGNFKKIVISGGYTNSSFGGDGWKNKGIWEGSEWTGNASSVPFSGYVDSLEDTTPFTITFTIAPNQWTNGNFIATLDGTKLTIEKADGAENGDIGSGWTPVGSTPEFYTVRSSITEVEIQDGVTSIGDSAFFNFVGLKSVTIPGSVTSIADEAFSNCKSLKNLTFNRPSAAGSLSVGKDAFVVFDAEGYIPIRAAIAYAGDGDMALFDEKTEVTAGNYIAYNLNSKTLTWKEPAKEESDYDHWKEPAEEENDYVITIPATLDVSDIGWNSIGNISATGHLASGKKLTVTAESGDEFALVNTTDDTQKVTYTINNANESGDGAGVAATSWDFTDLSGTPKTQAIGIDVEDYSEKPVGTYTDTVTFTASVESAAPGL